MLLAQGESMYTLYLEIIFVKKLIKEIYKNIKRTFINYHLIDDISYIINKKMNKLSIKN